MFDFKGKSALVTGGTTGIGFCTAKMLAQGGADVVITGRSESKGNDAQVQLSEVASKITYISGDVSDVSDCRRFVKESKDRMGRLDILVNSAGVYMHGPIHY